MQNLFAFLSFFLVTRKALLTCTFYALILGFFYGSELRKKYTLKLLLLCLGGILEIVLPGGKRIVWGEGFALGGLGVWRKL